MGCDLIDNKNELFKLLLDFSSKIVSKIEETLNSKNKLL